MDVVIIPIVDIQENKNYSKKFHHFWKILLKTLDILKIICIIRLIFKQGKSFKNKKGCKRTVKKLEIMNILYLC